MKPSMEPIGVIDMPDISIAIWIVVACQIVIAVSRVFTAISERQVISLGRARDALNEKNAAEHLVLRKTENEWFRLEHEAKVKFHESLTLSAPPKE